MMSCRWPHSQWASWLDNRSSSVGQQGLLVLRSEQRQTKRGAAHLAPLLLPNNLSLLHCIQNHFAAYLRPGSLGDLARELSFATISANCFYVWSYLSSPLHAPRLEHLKNSLLLSIYFNLLAQKSLDRDCLRAAKAAADSCLSPPSHRQPEELC